MIDFVLHDNGTMDVLLPGAVLREASCFATLEDQGKTPLSLGEIERGERFVRVHLENTQTRVEGELTLREGEDFCYFEARVRASRSSRGEAVTFAGRESFVVQVGEIEKCDALLCESLIISPWWTDAAFPMGLAEVPERTQLMLARTDRGALFLLPLVGDMYKTELCGGEGGLKLSMCIYDCGYDRLEGAMIALAADEDPYTAVENGFARCVENDLIRTRLKADKEYPEMMESLGWCSWNAFYHEVDERGLLAKLDELKEKHVPVGWVLIDDGWSPVEDGKLIGLHEDQAKFPGGLRSFIRRAHEEYGVGQVGVWHAFNGYWQGIHEDSPLVREMRHAFTRTKDGHLLPGFEFGQSFEFFNAWHQWLREQGVDFVKVDNQSSLLSFVRNNAPMKAIAETHRALEASVRLNFTAPLINCMGMSNENEFNRADSVVSRNSDDFFPDRENGFVSHVIQNAYNSVFYDQLYVCDYDMWWTVHPTAVVSAVLRAVSGGPIYVSDKVGQTDPAMLLPLIEEDGRIIRCDHAAKPALSCLFEDVRRTTGVLKVTNRCGANAVTAVFNLTGEEKTCRVAFEDTECERGTRYLAYLHFAKKYVPFDQAIELTLPANGAEIVNLYPIEDGKAVVGEEDKYVSAGSRKTHVVTL